MYTFLRETDCSGKFWLEELVKESFLKKYPVQVIYNEIDRTVFKPTEVDFRKKYRLEGEKMILGVAGIWSRRKGLDDFIRLSKTPDKNGRLNIAFQPGGASGYYNEFCKLLAERLDLMVFMKDVL